MIYLTADFSEKSMYQLAIYVNAELIYCSKHLLGEIFIHYVSSISRFLEFSITMIASFFIFYAKLAEKETTTQLYKPVVIS